MYVQVLHDFRSTLKTGPASWQARAQFLDRQHDFVKKVVGLVKAVARENGSRKVKIEKLQSLLAKSGTSKEHGSSSSSSSSDSAFNFVRFEPVMKLPVDPTVEVTGIIPKEASLFKSSLAPALFSFVR